MSSVLKRASTSLRWALVGLVSGLLSCALAQSSFLYLAREQRTIDHIVWPGIVFALVALLPMSRWAGDSWPQTVTTLLTSATVYPIAWQIAAPSVIRTSTPAVLSSFACAGLLGSSVLACVFLCGRPGWLRATITTLTLGAALGLLMGAHLRVVSSYGSAGTVLGVYMVLWQTVIAASLSRGARTGSIHVAAAPDHAPGPVASRA